MSYAGGINWVAIQKALHNWVVACTGLDADKVIWSQQYAPRPTQAAINLKLAFVQDDGMPWVDYETDPLDDTLLIAKQRSLLKAVFTLEAYTNTGVGLDMASAILWRINAKRKLPTPSAILEDANIGVIEFGRIKNIGGTQDLVIFEPRALVDIMLHITSEDEESENTIETVEITNEDESTTFTVDGTP